MAWSQSGGLIAIGIVGTLGLFAAHADFGAPKEQPEIVHSTAFLRPARSADDDRHAFARLAAGALRRQLRDPDSLVIEDVTVIDKPPAACVTYRAKNGFGGYNRETAAYYGLELSSEPTFWNAHCAGRQGYPVSAASL